MGLKVNKKRLAIVIVIIIVTILTAVIYIVERPGPGAVLSTAIPLSGTESGYYNDRPVYYKFSLNNIGQRAIVTIASSAKLTVWLYNSSILTGYFDEYMAIGAASLETKTEDSACLVGPIGTYYAEVEGNSGAKGDYTISVSYVQAPTGALVGGSFSNAIEMTQVTTTGYVGQNQSVYYKLLVEKGFAVSISSSANLFLIVYHPDQRQWAVFRPGDGDWPPGVPQPDYYYVEVWGLEAGSFTLRFFNT